MDDLRAEASIMATFDNTNVVKYKGCEYVYNNEKLRLDSFSNFKLYYAFKCNYNMVCCLFL